MKYVIDSSQRRAAYQQLYLQLREDIVGGIYTFGEKLPSKRTVAEEVGVSTVTVEHAYALLCDEGYAEARERSGFFVVFRTEEGFAAPSRPAVFHPVPHSRTDASPEFPLSVLTKTMRSVMADYQQRILERSPNCGTMELREAIRKYLARSRGIAADCEQIVIGSGSEYLYGLIVELLGRDRTYAIESPSYKKIEQVYCAAGVSLLPLPLGNDGIESRALWDAQAQVLHISPYRSFPSGVTASASKRHEYLRWAHSGERFIIEDDFESEFSLSKKAEETLFSHTEHDNVIYMNTFSKTLSPSFRIGYMVLPHRLVAPFKERLGFYSCTVPTYMQFVLSALLENGDFERHINRVRRKKRKELLGK
ncbi:MAG: PLP-dependent aminotransferase family protein [Clostridia bacterium]|nr:PLP-dependent aminotransferase family protein [Clostridia bacterium]